MITNCLQNQIANATGKLQPTILTAILNVYNRGLRLIKARDVREECKKINNSVPWDGRIPAICNAMRNATECGGSIIGSDVNSNEFSISLDNNITNTELPKEQIISKVNNEDGIIKSFTENNELTLSKNYKVVMTCASKKNDGGDLIYNGQIVKFYAQSNIANNEFLPDNRIPNMEITWRDFVLTNQNQNIIPFRAYELYKRNEYRQLFNRFGNSFYVLSAGWGLVKADFRLPNYDITFSNNAELINKRNYNLPPAYIDFNHLENTNDNEDIIYVGGENYLSFFYNLTENLKNRKIIYYHSINHPKPHTGNFLYRRYYPNNPKLRTNWHYELAGKISKGIIP